MRVLRIYHMGRDPAHRARERALHATGIDVTLVVPQGWTEAGSEQELGPEPFEILALPVRRSGDVNRHTYADADLDRVVRRLAPDLVDLHEEPFSLAARQWLRATGTVPAVGYTAQNVDKRFPPPFAQYEKAALASLGGLYPCSRQAASVARGKGATGLIEVLPLGYDDGLLRAGGQTADAADLLIGLVGRLVPEKGVADAVRIVAGLGTRARLVVVGQGPEQQSAQRLADELGVRSEWLPWQDAAALAELYRRLHVVLVPSRSTGTWVEQFGRIIVEGQASGAVVAGYRSGAIGEVAGDAAVLADEGDWAGLTQQLKTLLEDTARYAALREAGLTRSSDLTWRAVADRQVRFYEQVLAKPPRQAMPADSDCRRAAAQAEFGPPATLAGGVARPFALPLLRRNSAASRLLGKAVDALAR